LFDAPERLFLLQAPVRARAVLSLIIERETQRKSVLAWRSKLERDVKGWSGPQAYDSPILSPSTVPMRSLRDATSPAERLEENTLRSGIAISAKPAGDAHIVSYSASPESCLQFHDVLFPPLQDPSGGMHDPLSMWECAICTYLHENDESNFLACALCGAAKDETEKALQEVPDKKIDDYGKQDIEWPKKDWSQADLECSICLEFIIPIHGTRTSCGHAYHSCCIGDWLHRCSRCPMCNSSVDEESSRRPMVEAAYPKILDEVRDVDDRKLSYKLKKAEPAEPAHSGHIDSRQPLSRSNSSIFSRFFRGTGWF